MIEESNLIRIDMYKYILAGIISASICNSSFAAEEVHVVDENGDAEIYILKEGAPNTYVASGIYAEPNDKPTIKVYTSDSGVRVPVTNATSITTIESVTTTVPVTSTIPVIVTQGEYVPLVDTGGTYDAGGDVYRPKIQFKGQ